MANKIINADVNILGALKENGLSAVTFTTTEPAADNASGKLTIIALPVEPTAKYNGYLYIKYQPPGGSVDITFTISAHGESMTTTDVYDGQDDTGALLLSYSVGSHTFPQTVTCASGFLYVKANGIDAAVTVTSHTDEAIIVSEGTDDVVFAINGNAEFSASLSFGPQN